jgi:heme A synthase
MADPDADEGTDADAGDGIPADSRDVVVPLRLYKTVTVFSTLFAVVFVLAGFILLDVATDRATAELSEIDPLLAILGLVSLVAGAGIYAFSTRFRAEGMGKSKDESDEDSGNG